MQLLIQIAIIVHVAAGIGALISGAIAFSFRKNTPRHKPIGKTYFYMMTIVFVTGIFLSLVKALLFFFFIAVLTYYNTLVAYRALKLKELHKDQKPSRLDWGIHIAAALSFLGLVILGILSFVKHQSAGAIVPFAFGLIGLNIAFRNMGVLLKKPTQTNYWLKIHIGNMMGSYIGAITAFLVNQADKIPIHPSLLWLAPTLIILPVLIVEMKKVKSEPFPVKQQ
jgi:uncharacterized membrane protein